MTKKKKKIKVKPTHPVNFRMDSSCYALIAEEMAKQDRSVAWLMNKLVENYLKGKEKI